MGAGFRAGNPSEANVDDDGVRGRFIIIALVGIGLSINGFPGDRTGAGNRVGSPDNMLKVFGLYGELSAGVVGWD